MSQMPMPKKLPKIESKSHQPQQKKREGKVSIQKRIIPPRLEKLTAADTVPEEVTEDVLPEILEELKQGFYNTKVKVAAKTIDQGSSELWKSERSKRITASIIGGIVKMRASTSRVKKVEHLLYSKFEDSKATMYGSVMESVAENDYVLYQNQHGHPGLKLNV